MFSHVLDTDLYCTELSFDKAISWPSPILLLLWVLCLYLSCRDAFLYMGEVRGNYIFILIYFWACRHHLLQGHLQRGYYFLLNVCDILVGNWMAMDNCLYVQNLSFITLLHMLKARKWPLCLWSGCDISSSFPVLLPVWGSRDLFLLQPCGAPYDPLFFSHVGLLRSPLNWLLELSQDCTKAVHTG